MPPLIAFKNISKKHGHQKLFQGFSFGVEPRDRIGIVGPNGSGKSTLLKILAGEEDADEGEVIRSKGMTMSYASQSMPYADSKTISELIENSSELHQTIALLDTFGLKDLSLKIGNLSGGQKKKLQLAISLSEDSELILLDEPSNHLDFDSILGLEKILTNIPAACVMISHDRWLLENFADTIIEVNKVYENGAFVSEGGYGDFLENRQLFLDSEAQRINSLKSKVRIEQAWLRQGAKARSTKSRHRTESAQNLIQKLKADASRRNVSESGISFASSGRRTKDLIDFESISKSFGEKKIFDKFSLKVQAGMKLGLLGANGSGKSTFLKIILDEIKIDSGEIKRASNLKVSYFSQVSEEIDPVKPLQRVLTEDGDSVVYQGRSIHVASWATRFQFDARNLLQPYGSLSGGEKAKAKIAKLMLETPDILLLDEPTNDLDISTLEILEESLLAYQGALVLVTHDRFMLNRVCSSFLGLREGAVAMVYASYDQWMADRNGSSSPKSDSRREGEGNATEVVKSQGKQKLSYNDQREYAGMEKAISKAEKLVEELSEKVSSATPENLEEACSVLGTAQKRVEELYARWAELEAMISG